MIGAEEFRRRLSTAFALGVTVKEISDELDIHPRIIDEWIKERSTPSAEARQVIVTELVDIQERHQSNE